MTLRPLLFLVGLAAASSPLLADITLAPLFRDGAVLQRDQPIVVWGRAAAAERVEVRFNRQVESVIASADGKWRVTLKPEKASSAGTELVVSGANTVRVRDVLVGEVWLCSGQSNMAFLVRSADNAEAEIAAANYPLIRHYKVPSVTAEQPQFDVQAAWVAASPATVGAFSAVAYYFARDLHERLRVPIGLVNSSWGGTQIESWMSEAALRASAAGPAVLARWEAELAELPQKQQAHEVALQKWESEAGKGKTGKGGARKKPAAPEGKGSRRQPSALYNAMIAPLVPYTMRGALWYQGEANAARHAEYAALFPAMIKQWRADFGQALPFYFVQLANFEGGNAGRGDSWAFQREAQARALALPQTGMAVTIDIGDPADIHPRNKQDVGKRLALQARKQIYGEAVEAHGPMFSSAKREGNAMRVTFAHGTGLRVKRAAEPARVAFQVAGEDRKFVPAEAEVDGECLVVSAPSVKAPVAVRYGWANAPEARLFNGAGLPAAPFRSDNW